MHPAVGWCPGVDPCLALCAAFCLKTDGVLVSCLCCVWQYAKLPFLQPAHTCAVRMLRCWQCIQGWHCRKLVLVHLSTAEDSCYLCLLIALGHTCLCCPACVCLQLSCLHTRAWRFMQTHIYMISTSSSRSVFSFTPSVGAAG